MARISTRPEDWPLRNDYVLVGDIVLPRLRLLGLDEMQPNQESIHPPPPPHQNDRDISDSVQRTREEDQQIQARPSNLTPTPIELMIPGLDLPAMDQVAQNQIAELSSRQLPKFHAPTLSSDVGDEVHSNHQTSSPPRRYITRMRGLLTTLCLTNSRPPVIAQHKASSLAYILNLWSRKNLSLRI
jgi:hypothetical protein